MRTEVAAGGLREGDRLPTIRKLTAQLNVNPNTVAKAYRELELSGVIFSQRGNGSFIRQSADQGTVLSDTAKSAKLTELYERMKSEAAGFGISELEVGQYILKRNTKQGRSK